MKRLLYVCTGNTCRSPLAKVLTEEQLTLVGESGWSVDSAGLVTRDGLPASSGAAAAAEEAGLDLTNHRSKQLTPEMATSAELVLVMTRNHKKAILDHTPHLAGKVFTIKEFVGEAGDVSDPFGGSLSCYRQTTEELRGLARRAVEKLRR